MDASAAINLHLVGSIYASSEAEDAIILHVLIHHHERVLESRILLIFAVLRALEVAVDAEASAATRR